MASFSQESFALTSVQKSASPGGFTDLTLTKPLHFFDSLHFFWLSMLWHHLKLEIFTQIPLKMQISRSVWSYIISLCIPWSWLHLFYGMKEFWGGEKETDVFTQFCLVSVKQRSCVSPGAKCSFPVLWSKNTICKEDSCFFKGFFSFFVRCDEISTPNAPVTCWCSCIRPGVKVFSCDVFKFWKNSLAVRLFCPWEWKRSIR